LSSIHVKCWLADWPLSAAILISSSLFQAKREKKTQKSIEICSGIDQVSKNPRQENLSLKFRVARASLHFYFYFPSFFSFKFFLYIYAYIYVSLLVFFVN